MIAAAAKADGWRTIQSRPSGALYRIEALLQEQHFDDHRIDGYQSS
jgi:hypothetical protein